MIAASSASMDPSRGAAVDAANRGQLLAVAGRAAHDADQREVRQHEARRHVEARRRAFAPRAHLLRDAAGLAAQLAGALHAPPRELGLGPGADAQAPLLALVGRPVQAAHRFEPFDEHVVQREEVLDVGRGVEPLVDVNGRRVQSVRRSPLVSRTSRRRSTSDASDGAPRPMNPAATCVSKSRRAAVRTRARGSRGPARPRGRPSRPGRGGSRRTGPCRRRTDRSARCRPTTRPARARGAASRCAHRGTRCRAYRGSSRSSSIRPANDG